MTVTTVGKILGVAALGTTLFVSGTVLGAAAKENHLQNAMEYLSKAHQELNLSGSKSPSREKAVELTKQAMDEVREAMRLYDKKH